MYMLGLHKNFSDGRNHKWKNLKGPSLGLEHFLYHISKITQYFRSYYCFQKIKNIVFILLSCLNINISWNDHHPKYKSIIFLMKALKSQFHTYHSTEASLLKVIADLQTGYSNGQSLVLILIFQKHLVLMAKPSFIRFREVSVSWVSSSFSLLLLPKSSAQIIP